MTSGPFRIGAQIATPGYMNYTGGEDILHYDGELDNFAVYDHELTRDDVLKHYVVGYDLFSR